MYVMMFGLPLNTVGNVATCNPVEKSTALEMRPCASCCSPVSGSSTMRSTAGSLPTPAATPHQESLRSNTFWVGETFTTFHGPVVTGQPFSRSNAVNFCQSWPSNMCLGTMCRPISYL